MRPQLLKVSKEPGQSFSVRRDLVPYVNNRWHFHTEVELIHIKKGQGMQFVGDDMRRFRPGDVVLVGSNLPHHWRFDDACFEVSGGVKADILVAQFCENFCGDAFLQLPETVQLRTVLDRAKRGLQVEGDARKKVAGLLEKMLDTEGLPRLLLLLEALQGIAASSCTRQLSSIGFQKNFQEAECERIDTIYEYSLKNFRRPILLGEISAVANISPNSFCRFFKSRTRKTYSRFLIEIRVGHACKLLIENNLNIKQLCYECGFSNFTSFYKYFKLITGKSPSGYQREFSNFSLKKSYA